MTDEGPSEPPQGQSTNFLQVPTRHDLELLSSVSSVLELSSIGEEYNNEQETTQNV